jgi:protein TonB
MVAKTETLGRGARLTLVAGIHVAVAYAIMASLGVVKPVVFTEPMSARVIDAPAETQPLDPVVPEEPQLTEPTLTEPTPVEVPQIPTEVEAPPAPAAITTSPSEPVETAQMQVTNRVEPVYPPASRRMGEEGTGTFRVLVDERGRPTEVEVLQSSGFARLDQAALDAIKRWRFKPAVRDGQPVPSWTRVSVKFQLT